VSGVYPLPYFIFIFLSQSYDDVYDCVDVVVF
jgi:hypothetical protein